MDCATISLPAAEARRKIAEYEYALSVDNRHATEADRKMLAAFKAVANGRRLLDVTQAIVDAGLNRAGQPKLAIARANARECSWIPSWHWGHGSSRHAIGGGRFDWSRIGQRITDDRVRWLLPDDAFEASAVACKPVKAFTPLIPLPLRPRRGLQNYFLLWEANWFPTPPVDPYLLRPVHGSLMEIVAEWDVTPLENAVVRQNLVATPV